MHSYYHGLDQVLLLEPLASIVSNPNMSLATRTEHDG